MTDRELLELAAKAAGLTPDVGVKIKSGHLMVTGKDADQPFFWNPLTDDGDALRLAVKLEMLIDTVNRVVAGYLSDITVEIDFEEQEKDPLAATRRAIVRAAAQIGKNMV